MTGSEGGFYASQDADSEGAEGRFYVWTPDQLAARLGRETASGFADAYEVSEAGNFENGTTHLNDRLRAPREKFAPERAALLETRAERIAPATDTKRVTAWNAWTVAGLARSGALLRDRELVHTAARCADFLLATMRDERGRVLRVYHGEHASGTGFLEDVAALLDACLALYVAAGDPRYLDAAVELGENLVARFWDSEQSDFFLTPSDGETLVHRPRAESDGATPHAAGLAGRALYRLAWLGENKAWEQICSALLRSNAYFLEHAPEAVPTLARLAALCERGPCVAVVCTGDGFEAMCDAVLAELGPDDLLIRSTGNLPRGVAPSWLEDRDTREGRATAYICRGVQCSLPVTDAQGLRDVAEFQSPSARVHSP